MAKKQTASFETQINSLEEVVSLLEEGDLSLDESLAQFEKGVKLTKECQTILSKAEQKVAILSEQTEVLEPFEDE